MRDTIDRTIGIVDETSVVIACSELGRIGEVNESINAETLSSTVPYVINGYTYKSFGANQRPEYAVFVSVLMRQPKDMRAFWLFPEFY